MRQELTAKGSRRCGVVMVWAVVAIGVLVLVTALAIDVGVVIVGNQQLQNAADAAALAAASKLQSGMDEVAGTEAAVRTAQANAFLSDTVTLEPHADVTIGGWDAENQKVVPWSPTFNSIAVSVTARATADGPNHPVPMTFGSAIGLPPVELTANAVAGVRITGDCARKDIEVGIVQDASGSFEQEWTEAIEADQTLINMVNDVSAEGDHSSFAAFNGDIARTYEWHWSWSEGWYREYENLTYELTEFNDGDGEPLPDNVDATYDDAAGHSPQGWTNPAKALAWTLDEFEADGTAASNQVIVLVSDGIPKGPDEQTTRQYRDYAVAEADRAENMGVTIHTVTLTAEDHGEYGYGGADFEFNASLCRNGGYAFRTADPQRLMDLLITVGDIELGGPRLMM